MRLILPIIVSVVYVAIVGWLLYIDNQNLQSLELNELGDFLAGILGPIAILWLVTGIFLQSSEMRLNTEEVRQARLVAGKSLSATIEANFLERTELTRKIRESYIGNFVYIDHDDATLLRYSWDHIRKYGDLFAEISRDRAVFSIRNFGQAAHLVKVEAEDIYRPTMPFTVKFVSPFGRHNMLTESSQEKPIQELSSGFRYHIVFEFDKTVEPRLSTLEHVDFQGSVYLYFDMFDRDGIERCVIQEIVYEFQFDDDQNHRMALGVPNDTLLQFHPPFADRAGNKYEIYA